MFTITKQRSPHGARLERWLGADVVANLSLSMRDWYGPAIGVGAVPGRIYAHKGGDFSGILKSGQVLNGVDWALGRLDKIIQRIGATNASRMNAGFASLSDLIAESTAGKRCELFYNKAGSAGVVGVTNSLWGLGAQPAAGANAANAPGGEAPTSATLGAVALDNVSTDTRHIVSAWATASIAGQSLLCYDRIFQVNKTMNSAANEAVTGVPTRYQSTTTTAPDYAGGNFLFVEVGGTALAATAHNWGVAGGANECLYRNQAGTDNTVLPVLAGNASAIVRRLDHPVQQWFAPLANGDTGIMDLAQMRCSAAVATGVVNFVIGHPICWIPVPIINLVCQADYINTAFNLARIFDGAALAFLEVMKPATNATTYNIGLTAVHG
jgi:hypothetical protein